MAEKDASSGPSATSLTLLDRIRISDREAWSRLVAIYGPLVYDWCRRQGLQAADAADVVQEVFRTVWGKIGGFRREQPGDSFRGWLWTITRSRVADHFRAQAGRAEAFGGTDALARWQQVPGAEPASGSEPNPLADPIHRALAYIRPEFRPRTWEAFQRSVIGGHPAADVAASLGITVNAVRKAKSRVLRRLRDEFGDLL